MAVTVAVIIICVILAIVASRKPRAVREYRVIITRRHGKRSVQHWTRIRAPAWDTRKECT